MFIKYEQILMIYTPFFSVLTVLSNNVWQGMHMQVYDYKKIMSELNLNRPFSRKLSIFL